MNMLARFADPRVSLKAHDLSARFGADDADIDDDDDAIRDGEAEPLEDDVYPGNDEYEEIEEDEL